MKRLFLCAVVAVLGFAAAKVPLNQVQPRLCVHRLELVDLDGTVRMVMTVSDKRPVVLFLDPKGNLVSVMGLTGKDQKTFGIVGADGKPVIAMAKPGPANVGGGPVIGPPDPLLDIAGQLRRMNFDNACRDMDDRLRRAGQIP